MLDPDDEYADTSIFENKAGLSDDMRFLASMPELCDVTFLVGETREPVCAVKAVLGARSRWEKLARQFRQSRFGVWNCTRSVFSQGISKDAVPQRASQCGAAGHQGVVERSHNEGGKQAESVHQEELGASLEHGA